MKRFFSRAVAGAAIVAMSAMTAQTASAQLGTLNIVGSTRIFQQLPGAANNVIIDFRNPDAPPVADGEIEACCFAGDQTGIFAGIANGTSGRNIDFVFGPGAVPPTTTTPVNILTIGGHTFLATSFGLGNTGTPITLTQTFNPFTGRFSTSAELQVAGTVTGGSLTGPAAFVGQYTTQFPGRTIAQVLDQIENNTGFTQTVSGTFIVTAVPEPATVGLMATGLIAIAGVGLRRRTS